jgi:hypothetical protein
MPKNDIMLEKKRWVQKNIGLIDTPCIFGAGITFLQNNMNSCLIHKIIVVFADESSTAKEQNGFFRT